MKGRLAGLLGALLVSANVSAQTDDDFRGGWTTEHNGRLQIFLFKLRDGAVTGVHCAADCRDPANLVLIESGRIDGDRIDFSLWYAAAGQAPVRERVSGELTDGRLRLTRGTMRGSGIPVELELVKTPAPPLPPAGVGGGNARPQPPRPAYAAPGPAEQLSPDKLAGLWIAGSGPAKQNFIFRQKEDGLFGMVCGPCDDTNAMAPLDGIVIDGTRLLFNIVHEDWGIGIEDGVFNMISVGSVAANELHFTAVRDTDASGREAVMTLLGPIEYQPTE